MMSASFVSVCALSFDISAIATSAHKSMQYNHYYYYYYYTV